jgi:hypothetical protein
MANPEPGAPTPERRRRSTFALTPAVATEAGPARAGARVYRALSSLERLVRNGTIEPRQAQAGERLRDDYELGVEGAREPANGSVGTTGWYYPEAQLAAIERCRKASVVLGPLEPYVLPVVLGWPGFGDVSIAQLARTLRRNRQEVAGILKLGLTALADHYGINP